MAREPQARRPQASAGDDFYGEEEIERQDDRRQDGNENADDQNADATFEDDGEGQETGDEENLGADGDEFFEEEIPRATRGGQRIQTLANELRETRRELAELRRPTQTAPAGPREETDVEFESRLALLSAEERMEERYKRDRAFQARRDAARDFQTANEQDRNKFEAEAQKNRFAAKLRDRVETEFQDRMRRGQPVSRMDLYFWLRGQMADKTGVKDTATARQQARERLDRNTVPVGRSGGGRSDVEAPRGRRQQLSEREARARRLDGQQI